MKIIYRVESRDGVGFYQAYNTDLSMDELCKVNANHPTPYGDDGLRKFWKKVAYPYLWYFGFADVEQLTKWFPGSNLHQAMKEDGMVVGVYSVADKNFKKGDYQAVFIKNKAKLIKIMEMTEIMD